MVHRGYGKIIFTASMLSFQGGVNVVSYAAAKSGIAGLTRALANEWAIHGVNVNAIAPGYIATDNTRALPGRSRAQREHRRAHPGRPLGAARRPGRCDGLPGLGGCRLRPWRGAGGGRRMARAVTKTSDE
jgi:NAD(P)-dependent dehydrogenase (short-subunit alcohol dehydrogenase family)